MRGKGGSIFHFDGYREEGIIEEYVLTHEKWSCDYRLGGADYHEEATSGEGVTYTGTWGKPGERYKSKTIVWRRYKAKNGDELLIGQWFESDRDAGGYMYQLPGGENRERPA